jgi:hypothetical protein
VSGGTINKTRLLFVMVCVEDVRGVEEVSKLVSFDVSAACVSAPKNEA